MLVKQAFSNERIIDCLNTDYGIEIVSLTFLPIGADMNASVFKAEGQDKLSYFVKLKGGQHHDIGIDVVDFLHHAGIQQIIPPIPTVHGQLNQEIDDFTIIVYPFVEGENGFKHDLTEEQWFTLGKALRQVHEIDLPSSIRQQIRQEVYSPKWREIVRSLYDYIKTDPKGDEIALKLLAFMKENSLKIHALVDRAEYLAQILQNESHNFVLCHSDIHAGNVLIDKNNTLYIVDWDEPILAPKERDLMFIGGGVANVWNNLQEENLFYKGYGKTEINRNLISYYRHERIVQDIALYGQDILLTPKGGGDRAEMYQHFIAMFEANGVVEIALGMMSNDSL